MKQLLALLLERLRGAPTITKLVLGFAALATAGIIAASVAVANRPHYEVLRSGLNDEQFARVGEALASAGVRWRGSQPPGPLVVWVDRDQMGAAFDAVMLAGALKDVEGGILTRESGGMGSVFMYSKEREQLTRKKEWQDMEAMLEFQGFIQEARVRTSGESSGLFGTSGTKTASVTLVTRHGSELTRAQSNTVGELVRLGLGIDPAHLVVADQNGKTLFNGPERASGRDKIEEWLEHAETEDERLAATANIVLQQILGPDLARVTVRSDWDFDRTTTLADTSDPKAAAVVAEQKRTTSTPYYGPPAAGGSTGTAANLAAPDGFGIDNQSTVDLTRPGSQPVSAEPTIGKTTDETKSYTPSRVLSETVRNTPVRRRMSISLWIDESLAAQRSALEDAVKASVGFDAQRSDQFQSVLVPFQKDEVTDEAATVVAPEQPLNPWIQLAFDRGIEVIAALVFGVLLLSSLKKGKRTLQPMPPPEGAVQDGNDDGAPDPELLALEKVRSLLEDEPEKVGELLTSWARGEGEF